MGMLETLATELPSLQLVSQEDADYEARRKIYNSAVDKKPLAIVVAKSADEVAAVVKFASYHGADITIRAGGHDLFGRSLVDDAIVIDIRALNEVQVNKHAGTAKVGGGVLSLHLSKALAEHGCITPCPNIAT